MKILFLGDILGPSGCKSVKSYLPQIKKKNKIDFIIQKATEMGVKKIFPILTERSSIRKINTTRMYAIAKEASEQSNRISILTSKICR